MSWLISWYWLAVKHAVKNLWDSLPGPWWCKIILIAITQAIPGPQDELILFAGVALYRAWRKRR